MRDKNLEAWSKWEWQLQDIALAERHGVSRERVRQIRKTTNAPKSMNFHRKRKVTRLAHVATSIPDAESKSQAP